MRSLLFVALVLAIVAPAAAGSEQPGRKKARAVDAPTRPEAADHQRPVRVAVRGGESGDAVVDLELQNVSTATVDTMAELQLTLRPLERRPPLFGGILFSSADAATGRFGGGIAARQGYPPDRHLTTLRLEAGERRTIKLELLALRWSLGPDWVEQPRDFWDLAARGTYVLHAVLVLDAYPTTAVAASEHRLRIERR